MGDEIEDPLDLIPNKWYCVGVEVWSPGPPDFGCAGIGPLLDECCQLGQTIIDFIDLKGTCDINENLCRPFGINSERILTIKGPYDTQVACNADCP